MNLKIITQTDHPNHPGFKQMKRSLEHFGYDYHVLNHPWKGFGTKIRGTRDYLSEIAGDYTHFVFVDAHDTFFLGPPDELTTKLFLFRDHLTANAEKACWPDANLEIDCPRIESEWRFLNSGVYSCPVRLFCELLDAHPIAYHEDDQRWMTSLFLYQKPDHLRIDHNCVMFQSIAFQAPGDFRTANGRIFNRKTKTRPTVVHGNGGTRMDWVYNLLP